MESSKATTASVEQSVQYPSVETTQHDEYPAMVDKLQEIDLDLTHLNKNDQKTPAAAIDMMGPPPEDDDGDEADTKQTIANLQNINPEYRAKRDKSKCRKKASNQPKQPKLPKPSGFEDYYVDSPLTPAEHREEQSLYSRSKSFTERYMLAIARYTNRRKFDEFRSRIFDKYMSYGGVGTGVKQFQGRVDEKDPDQTPVDTAMLKSKYHLRQSTLDESVVDFAQVTRGFVNSYLLSVQEMHRPEQFKACTNIIRNFLNYLLHHDVCPEYAHQIYDAKQVCDEADKQLPICAQLARELPGTFNQACSLLFGGYFQETYLEDASMAQRFDLDPGMRRGEAIKIFLAGLAATGTAETIETYNSQAATNSHTITTKATDYLEVLTTTPPTTETLSLYSLASQRSFRPIGTVTLSHWRHPAGPYPEMTPSEVGAYKLAIEQGNYARPEFTFHVDIDHLGLFAKGMKVFCTRYQTSFGVWYFDSVMAVLSPGYVWLPNEACLGWTLPKVLPRKARQRVEMGVAVGNGGDGGGGGDDDDDEGGDGDGEKKLGGEKGAGKEAIEQEDKLPKSVSADDSDDEDIPHEFKKYEKGEDIVITM